MAVCKPFIKLDQNILQANISEAEFDIETFDQSFVARYKAEDLSANLILLKSVFKSVNVDMTTYPYLSSKVQFVPMSAEELAQFQTEYGYSSERIQSLMYQFDETTTNSISAIAVLSPAGETFMFDLEDFYTGNVAAAASGGFCSTVGGIFAAISSLQSLVNKAQGVASSVTDLLEGDLSQLFGKIDSKISLVVGSVKSAIEALVRQIKSKISNAFEQIKNLPQNIHKGLSSALEAAAALLSEDGIATLKSNIEILANRFTSQFAQPISLDNVQLIVFRMCQIIESVNSTLMSPIDSVMKRINDAETIKKYTEQSSNYGLAQVKSLGIAIPSWEDRKAAIATTSTRANEISKRPADGGGVFMPDAAYIHLDVTDEERSWLQGYNGLSAFEDRDLKITTSIASMGHRSYQRYQSSGGSYWDSSQNYFSGASKTINGVKCFEGDSGLIEVKRLHPNLLVSLRRAAKAIGTTLTITSAYRSYYYQNYFVSGDKASVTSSVHSKAKAFDVLFPDSRSDASMAKFVEYASREGFTRIAAYTGGNNGFFHVDTHPKNGWARQYPNSAKHSSRPLGTLTKQAMTQHLNEGFTNASVSAAGLNSNIARTPI